MPNFTFTIWEWLFEISSFMIIMMWIFIPNPMPIWIRCTIGVLIFAFRIFYFIRKKDQRLNSKKITGQDHDIKAGEVVL